jgi:hypothetical protein
MRTIALALAAGAILSAGAVALASGPAPVDRGYPPPGVTAIGAASVRVDATSKDSETKIRRAVERANAGARPRAFADARRKAEAMAAVAGVRLGAVWSVGQDPNVPYPGGGVNQGTFGGNDYCGQMRHSAGYRIASNGRRVRRYVQRYTCRAPREVDVFLVVTFAQT